jgi:RNA polymerase sigma factor (sigma-70 family)
MSKQLKKDFKLLMRDNLKEEEVIKEKCKDWSPKEWEAYLSNIEVNQKDLFLEEPESIDNYAEQEQRDFVQNNSVEEEFPELKDRLFDIMKDISEKQRTVLYLSFWQGKTPTQIARQLNVSTPAITKLRDRALAQVAKRLISLSLVNQPCNEQKKAS